MPGLAGCGVEPNVVVSRPRLPRRLRAVLELLPHDARRVADIGAGHGALCAHLTASADMVIAIEAQAGPFAELRRNLERWSVCGVDVRYGAGFDPIEESEVDAAVIAGMGAQRTVGIAAGAPDKQVRWLVLQCMQDMHIVEPWIRGRGWCILGRDDVRDHGRVYPTWLVEAAT